MHTIRRPSFPGNIPWFALAALLVTGGLVYLLGPILTPFLAGALLAYIFDPLAAVLLVALREMRGVYEASDFYLGRYNAASIHSAASAMSAPLLESRIASLPLVHKGKVRDIYAVGNDKLLIVTTDRLSAFDVVMPTPIPGKGEVLTRVSAFWFDKLKAIVPSQALDIAPESVVAANERGQVAGRAIVVKKLKALPVEAIVRGYLVGSGWKEYQASQSVCGIALPAGLKQADRLPEPIFTPSTKAAVGAHDENIAFEQMVELIGHDLARQVRDVSLALYKAAAEYALTRGIIIADTKFEFGLDEAGKLVYQKAFRKGLAWIPAGHILRMSPAVVMEDEVLLRGMDLIDEAIGETAKELGYA